MSDCLTEEQLDHLACGEVAPPDAESLHAHIQDCATCRRLLEECRANQGFMSPLKTVIGRRSAIGDASTVIASGKLRIGDPGSTTLQADTIPGYSILHELHRGAQGVVYRAVQEGTGRKVAIKFLREGPFASPANRKRFEREIDLVQKLHHPNIIEVLHSGLSSSGHLYYVMDYVDGLPMHRYVWSRKLSIQKTLELFRQVCDAVNFAHQRGVLHRDLKPSNILVSPDGVPKILDFGLAKEVVDPTATMVSMTGQVVGTLPYMSPEQARGDQESIDLRTDVYALGIILYRILTGQYPYPVTGPMGDVLKHIAETPPLPPRRAWTRVGGSTGTTRANRVGDKTCPIDDEVETIILRTLDKDPQRRYQNVAALSEDVTRALAGQPIAAKRDARFHVLRKSVARYRMAVAATGASIILVTAFAVIVWGMYQQQSRERARAEAQHRLAVRAQTRLATALLQMGDLAMERGDTEDATGRYQAALTLNKHLTSVHMENPRYRWNLSETHQRLGDVARSRGDWGSAREHYEQFHRNISQLISIAPGHPGYRDRLAVSCSRMAEAVVQEDDVETARGFAHQAIAARRGLASESRATPEDMEAFAWLLLTVEPPSERDPSEALVMAMNAVKAASSPPVRERALTTLALAYERTADHPELTSVRDEAAAVLGTKEGAYEVLLAAAHARIESWRVPQSDVERTETETKR